jgi:hypothetical protein
MTHRTDEINEAMLAEMKLQGIEDTTQHRIWFLEGLRDGWKEDEDSSIEKRMYQMALEAELFRLKVTPLFDIR